MKKGILVSAFLIFANFAWSFPVVFHPSAKSMNLSWETRYRKAIKKDIGVEKDQVSTIIHFDADVLKTSVGANFNNNMTHLTTQCIYAPKAFKRLGLGVDTRFHFYDYEEKFHEFDLLISPYFKVDFWKFSFATEAGYFRKLTVIRALNNQGDPIKDNVFFYMANLSFEYGILRTYIETSTVTYFDYYLFCTPVYDFGFEIRPLENIGIGSSFVMKWTDQFTISSHCSEIYATFFLKVFI